MFNCLMEEPSRLKLENWQSKLMVRCCFVWETPCCSQQFVLLKMLFLEQILCLYKWITGNSIPPQDVFLAVSRSVKEKPLTMRF